MRRVVFVTSLLLASLSSYGQLILQPGESWTYEFQPSDFTAVVPPTRPASGAPTATVQWNFTGLNQGEFVRIELWESNLAEQPFFSASHPGEWPFPQVTREFVWRDLQGAVRVTMLQGSATLNSFSIDEAYVTGMNSSEEYFAALPVPEPGTIAIFAAGIAGLVYCGNRRRL